MATIILPTVEPATHVAGDTLKFTKLFSDYAPADGWTLSYTLVQSAVRIQFSGSDNGDGSHLINVAAATTALWTAGNYDWQSYVTKSTERYSVGRGRIEILANFATQSTGLDARTTWRRTVEQLEAGLLTLASGAADTIRIEHDGRVLEFRRTEDILSLLSYAQSKADAEDRKVGIDSGRSSGNLVTGVFE